MPLRVVAVAAAVAVSLSTFVSICCLLLLFGACSSTEHIVFFVWSSRCKQATKQVDAITAAAGGVCSTGCESLLVCLFVVVVGLFFSARVC